MTEGAARACHHVAGARLRRWPAVVGGPAAYVDALVCPRCGLPGARRQPMSAPKLGLMRLVNFAAWRLTRPVPLWLVSLYEREGAA